MSRRSTTAQASENVRVKEEKVKVKEEKAKGKRRADVEEEDEEEPTQEPADEAGNDEDAAGEPDGSQQDEDDAGSPRGNKRARVNGDGDSVPSGSQPQYQHVRVKTQPRGDDGYIPGSIVRIQLLNFVTYDYVQFCPGPYLNMIIGPNGTGKSSIACAIALGLNFPPAILGRANEIHSYVKNGTNSGYIEIELKGPKGKRNLVIRRSLNSMSKSSSFTINGQPASGNEIKLRMAELNVQVGNLCSFLPQDRVSEFAAMSPQQLLRETQLAAGDENLTKWHDTLISAGQERKAIQLAINNEEDSLRQMKERNEGIERDVQRYMERQRIQHLIALLEVLIPVAEYREIRKDYIDYKALRGVLRQKVTKLKSKNAPAHELLKRLEQAVKDVDAKRESLKKSTQAKFKKLGAKSKSSDDLEAECSDIVDKLASLKREEKNRLRDIKALDDEISRIQTELAKPRPADLPTEDEIRSGVEQLKKERATLFTRRSELNYRMEQVINKRASFTSALAVAQQDLTKQQDDDAIKLSMMQRWDKDTHDAILWVRENRHLFRMEVFETPFMRMSVKDKRFTNAVEACFAGTQMKSFITQCQEDCDTINHHINDTHGLGRKARITTWFRAYNENLIVPPPMSPEEMHQLRFDGYAIDYLDFPEGMRWFLTNLNLHRTAIALNGSAIDVNLAMQYVARPTHNHSGGASFINGSTMNIVSRSRYGKKAIGNMTRDVPPARNLNTPMTDPEVKRKIDERIREAQQGADLCEEEKAPIKSELDELDREQNEYQTKYDEVNRKKDILRKEVARITSMKSKLDQKIRSVKTLRAKPSAEKQRIHLTETLKANIQKRMQFAKDYTDLVHAIISEQQECTRVGLKYLQSSANKNALKDLCERKDEKYNNALLAFTEASNKFEEIKNETKLILERSRDALNNADPDIAAEYQQIENIRVEYDQALKIANETGGPQPDATGVDLRSVDELQAELDTQRANLEMNLNTNPGVVEQYEKRKRDIEQLEKTIEGRKKKEEKIARDIKNARDNWQPALQDLVNSIGKKFSAAFDRIGCAGEIRISEHEDYDKWAIDILVKFRNSEKLQLLTAHRQSGGERSLTTILYLMSLTEEARAPFSLVDEINQGMDQRAERMVHNSMVNVTCKDDSAQYFLITPKLLPDLDYDKKMKILCVNNGEWLPEERDIGNMNAMIDMYLATKRGNAASAL
ncbi:P-loop containing nucleoside triphosphate hydrolase protein [Pholiota conissans]|uniref:Structural maintenance of chromosomes protein 5 n=1 Tax=Pholiota conissans TaxID=109636 RepID=A0A9P5YX07_9AGAR|nr:P-loop containing nucleoside triphosphate hydrolase protein [Pholiota conissans]